MTLVVTGKDTGKVLDPLAIKSLIVQTAMEPGGPTALIAHAGLARL